MASTVPVDLYDLPPEFTEFRDAIRQIAQERVAPRAAEIDAKAEYPWDLRKLFAEHDLLGLPFSEEHGGTGTGTLMLNIAIEEIAKACASTALILMVQDLGTLPIRLLGSTELQERFLPRCATGEWRRRSRCPSPRPGSDPAGMRPARVRDGDEWVISGTKNWISNAGDRRLLRRVRRDRPRDAPAHARSSSRPTAPGFSVGKLEHKLGISGSPTGQPIFDDVRVPAENLIGEVGQGPVASRSATLERSRLGAAAQARRHRAGRDRLRRRATPRSAITFGQPINELQGIQFKLADMETRTAAARELLYRACAKADRGEPDLGKYSSMAKLFASDTAMAVTVEAVQVLGGYGYVSEYPVERMMRDAKITQIYEGTNEIQRVVIARQR